MPVQADRGAGGDGDTSIGRARQHKVERLAGCCNFNEDGSASETCWNGYRPRLTRVVLVSNRSAQRADGTEHCSGLRFSRRRACRG